MASLYELRSRARLLLDENAPADALAVYYTLHHPADRTELFVTPSRQENGGVDGFLVRARTGMDLFRPLVTLRARSQAAVEALVRMGLPPQRPVYLTVPADYAELVNRCLSVSEAEVHRLYRYDPRRYVPEINVLVMTSTGADGLPRCEIRAGDRAGAVAGINWQSPRFAEIYVYTEPAVRGRGWGKAVVRMLSGMVLKSGRTPLYVVSDTNEYSIRLAEAVGYVNTGTLEYVCQAALG
jgi:RimJ/RimL family protein N-acetyltransferase